ncbi:MAG: T9SS type A sorting domain-containing protein, partial [Chitinophagales bacterium]
TVGDIPEPMLLIDSIYNKTVFITDQSQNYCSGIIDWGDGATHFYSAYENNKPATSKQFSHTYKHLDDYIIKTTTTAGEELRDYEVQVLGLSNHPIGNVIPAQAGISLFPNPANDYVIVQNLHTPSPSQEGNVPNQSTSPNTTSSNTVSTNSPLERGRGVLSASITNLNGKQVKTIKLNPKLYQQKVDVSSLTNGVYLVRFEIDEQLVGTEKMVIAR